jgi:hypothetical protein
VGGRYIRVADRLAGTIIDTFLAALTCLGMIDAGMAMVENCYFAEDMIGAQSHACPAGLTHAAVELDKLRLRMTP